MLTVMKSLRKSKIKYKKIQNLWSIFDAGTSLEGQFADFWNRLSLAVSKTHESYFVF